MAITATTNADAFSILRSQAAANNIVLGTLSDVASVALTVANLMGGGGSGVEAGDVTSGTFGSSIPDTGIYSFPSQVGVGIAGAAFRLLRVSGTATASGGLAGGVAVAGAFVAAANADVITGFSWTPGVFTPGAFTGLQVKGMSVGAFSVATFTSPADPVGFDAGIITGTGATNAFGVRIAPPTGATNNYLFSHTTPATFSVKADGSMTVGGLITAAAAIAVTGAASFTTNLISTTALATPSALAATQFTGFASTVSGATLMGFGTTGDVTLKNRAGTDVVVVTSNTTGVTMAGALAITGALSGVTTLAASGLSSLATLDLVGAPGTAAASHVRFGAVTRTTIGANGAATALTAAPLGYLDIDVAGTIAQIPYYNRGA